MPVPTDEYGAAVYNHPNLVAYWRLDETSGTTVIDSSPGGTHTGTYVGSPVLQVTGAPGLTNKAVKLDGVDDYINISDFPITTSFAVEGWCKIDAFGSSFCLANRRTVSNIGGFTLEAAADGKFYWYVYTDTWHSVISSRVMALGVWHHVVGVYAIGGSALLMINGEDCGRAVGWGTVNNPASPLFRIGYNIAGALHSNGVIDEVAIYNSAIADATIRQHYRLGVKARDFYGQSVERVPELAGRWTFDEAGLNVFDHTGNGRTATLNVATAGNYSGIGGVGQSQHFNANNEANAAALPLANFSVEAWFLPNGVQGPVGGAACLVTDVYDATVSSNINYALWFDGGSLALRAGMHQAAVGWNIYLGPITLINQSWSHVVFTYDGTTGRLYHNGVEAVAPGTYTIPRLSPMLGLRIGRRWDQPDYINGVVDEVAIYSRALTSTEILEHYTKGAGSVWKVNLTGTTAGKATNTAVLRTKKALAAVSAGKATATGTVTKQRRSLAASAAGACITSAKVTRKRAVTALSAGKTTVTGFVTATPTVSGVTAGVAITTSTLKAKRSLVAVSGGRATTSGLLIIIKDTRWNGTAFVPTGGSPVVKWSSTEFQTTGPHTVVVWQDVSDEFVYKP
jgi:hypothetical protein